MKLGKFVVGGLVVGALQCAGTMLSGSAVSWAGDDPLACTVTFNLSDGGPIGALQYRVDYSKASGGFDGAGGLVNCTALLSSSLTAKNDDEGLQTLRIGHIALDPFAASQDLAICNFTSAGGVPLAGDFSVVVEDSAPADVVAAGTHVCGAPSTGLNPPFARDALVVLRTAVGAVSCDLCECDADNSGSITASDSLRVLKEAVGLAPGFICTECVGDANTTAPDASVTIEVEVECESAECGNQVTEAGEECDDGNTDSGDGCNDKCTVESCWVCNPGESGSECWPAEDGSKCNDGSFCNGYDTCLAGSCSEHSGDPCSEGGECTSTCDEKKQACENYYGDPCTDDGNPCTDDICDGKGGCGVANEASCDDGIFCNGEDVCFEGSCSHPGDPCPATVCNTCQEDSDSCFDADGTACTSDDNVCTDDMCNGAGDCAHPPIPLAPVCRWTVVGGSDTVDGKVRTRVDSQIMGGGGICGDTGDVGDNSQLLDQATWAMLGDTGNVLTVRPDAVVTNGSVVTGGGCIQGKQKADIFGSGDEGPICCADGDIALPGGNPANVINACGLHPMIADCTDAKAQIPYDISLLDSLGQTRPPLGDVIVPKGGVQTITADPGVNVINVSRLRINRNATLTLSGGANDVVILRIGNGLRSSLRGTVLLTGGLTADNVLFYVTGGTCLVNEGGEGAGTLFCPNSSVRLRNHTHWVGAIAGGDSTDIGWDVDVDHVPFLGLAQ